LLPTSSDNEVNITDYCQKLTLSIQRAQTKYKEQYDKSAASTPFTVGDLVLVHFPQEESGPKRKLSRPWHGPYRVISKNDPDVEVVKVFFSQEDFFQVVTIGMGARDKVQDVPLRSWKIMTIQLQRKSGQDDLNLRGSDVIRLNNIYVTLTIY